jgi:hypothetical protein
LSFFGSFGGPDGDHGSGCQCDPFLLIFIVIRILVIEKSQKEKWPKKK